MFPVSSTHSLVTEPSRSLSSTGALRVDVLLFLLHHPCPCEGEVVLTGTAHDDVVEDTDADVLQGLGDLVGRVDVLFGRVRFLSGVTTNLLSQ
jgi:hypothetical protein